MSLYKRAKRNGIDVFRVFDAMNDPRNLERAIQAVRKVDGHAQGTLSYTVSPVHTPDGWVELGKVSAIKVSEGDSVAVGDILIAL